MSDTIILDLDGTLCTEEKTFSKWLAQPLDGAIEFTRELKELGYNIIIYTARGWAEYRSTKEWLDQHKFKYDQLMCGKPIGDWIDDRSYRTIQEFRDKLLKE